MAVPGVHRESGGRVRWQRHRCRQHTAPSEVFSPSACKALDLTQPYCCAMSSLFCSLFNHQCAQVRTDDLVVRVDAAVNSGNTLASWAELTDPATSIQLLSSADEAYKAALQQEEDASVSPTATRGCLSPCVTACSPCNKSLQHLISLVAL